MNKLEEKHLEILEDNNTICSDINCCMSKSTTSYAQKSSEITADIAIKFLEWCNEPMYRAEGELGFRERALAQFPDNKEYILINEKGENSFGKGKFLTAKELFEEFINNHYEKYTFITNK